MKSVFQALAKNFLRGLLFVVPIVATVWVVSFVFVTLDSWINVEPLLDRRIRGVGFVLTVALITLTGFLASNFLTRWLFGALDELLGRLPLVKLLYTAVKDLTGAFVGEKKRFDKPVLVAFGDDPALGFLGFLTREDLSDLGLGNHVGVYFPQSYNFAGNLLVVPKGRIRPIAVDSKTVMTLIISGGVSGETEPARPGGVRVPPA